jgi:hypothetical protein
MQIKQRRVYDELSRSSQMACMLSDAAKVELGFLPKKATLLTLKRFGVEKRSLQILVIFFFSII